MSHFEIIIRHEHGHTQCKPRKLYAGSGAVCGNVNKLPPLRGSAPRCRTPQANLPVTKRVQVLQSTHALLQRKPPTSPTVRSQYERQESRATRCSPSPVAFPPVTCIANMGSPKHLRAPLSFMVVWLLAQAAASPFFEGTGDDDWIDTLNTARRMWSADAVYQSVPMLCVAVVWAATSCGSQPLSRLAPWCQPWHHACEIARSLL